MGRESEDVDCLSTIDAGFTGFVAEERWPSTLCGAPTSLKDVVVEILSKGDVITLVDDSFAIHTSSSLVDTLVGDSSVTLTGALLDELEVAVPNRLVRTLVGGSGAPPSRTRPSYEFLGCGRGRSLAIKFLPALTSQGSCPPPRISHLSGFRIISLRRTAWFL